VAIALSIPERTAQIRRDGRQVGWSEWGPVAGRPVVYCSGAATSSSLGFGLDALNTLGVRLLCVDRAGLGRSHADPDKSAASFAADVFAVLDHLGLPRVSVVGFSQGAPFALALAPRASRLALVAGQDELASPAVRPRLHPDIDAMVAAIEADRAAFEATLAARADAQGMFDLVLALSSPHDRAIYGEPAFAAAYRRSLDEGFAQGAGGYVRDVVVAMSPWRHRPEDVTVHVDLWYGLLDVSPVHSPDFGTTLHGRFPSAQLHQLADEGSSLLWTRAPEILSSLVRS
jgi:pimeloyl-ACP methyl ester carboxylesterase